MELSDNTRTFNNRAFAGTYKSITFPPTPAPNPHGKIKCRKKFNINLKI